MHRISAWVTAGFAAAMVIMQPDPSRAAASDSEFWVTAGGQGQVADDTSLGMRVENRRRDGTDDWILGAVVGVKLAETINLGVGLDVQETDGFTEVRNFQQLTFTRGRFDLRSRIEERFFDNAERMSLRLRQRIRYQQPIAQGTSGQLSAELLYQARDRTVGGPSRIDQWRFITAVSRRLNERLSLTGGYLLIIRPRPDGATRHTHIPQLTLSTKF